MKSKKVYEVFTCDGFYMAFGNIDDAIDCARNLSYKVKGVYVYDRNRDEVLGEEYF